MVLNYGIFYQIYSGRKKCMLILKICSINVHQLHSSRPGTSQASQSPGSIHQGLVSAWSHNLRVPFIKAWLMSGLTISGTRAPFIKAWLMSGLTISGFASGSNQCFSSKQIYVLLEIFRNQNISDTVKNKHFRFRK